MTCHWVLRTRDLLDLTIDAVASPETNQIPLIEPEGLRNHARTARVRVGNAAPNVAACLATMERFAVVPATTRSVAT